MAPATTSHLATNSRLPSRSLMDLFIAPPAPTDWFLDCRFGKCVLAPAEASAVDTTTRLYTPEYSDFSWAMMMVRPPNAQRPLRSRRVRTRAIRSVRTRARALEAPVLNSALIANQNLERFAPRSNFFSCHASSGPSIMRGFIAHNRRDARCQGCTRFYHAVLPAPVGTLRQTMPSVNGTWGEDGTGPDCLLV